MDETRDQIFYLRSLEQFSVMDQGKERGQGGSLCFSFSTLVRDKVQVILSWIQDDQTMQIERQKARRLKKKFSATKSVGSSPVPPASQPSVFSQTASKAGTAVKGFFNNLGSKPTTPTTPTGPSYKVQGGELGGIPVSGQVMAPSSTANSAASKLKSGIASFGHKVGGAVSSAAATVSAAAAQTVAAAKSPSTPA